MQNVPPPPRLPEGVLDREPRVREHVGNGDLPEHCVALVNSNKVPRLSGVESALANIDWPALCDSPDYFYDYLERECFRPLGGSAAS